MAGTESPEEALASSSVHAARDTPGKGKGMIADPPADPEDDDARDDIGPVRPRRVADLRDEAYFPSSYDDLPPDNDLDLTWYEEGGLGYKPRKHWCFLAVVVEFTVLVRVTMTVKDIDGRTVMVAFYTGEAGRELSGLGIKPGHTVAILYAEQHMFAISPPGIRLENSAMFKSFPAPLDKIMALSDEVQQYCPVVRGRSTCHGCGKTGAGMKRCAKCLSFSYCDQTCQLTGWNGKGHKDSCELLRDTDLRGLFTFEWEDFDDYASFPIDAPRDFDITPESD